MRDAARLSYSLRELRSVQAHVEAMILCFTIDMLLLPERFAKVSRRAFL